MSVANRHDRATMSSSNSERSESKAGAMKASANRSKRVLLVLCSSSSNDESAQQAHIARHAESLNLTPHRAFGEASRSPAVLVTCATPCLSGARGATSTCQPGGRRTVRRPRQPRSNVRQGQHQRPRSRSSGGRRPSGQAESQDSS